MPAITNQTTDKITTGAVGFTMASNDRLYIAEGVQVQANTTTGTTYDGVSASGAVSVQVNGTLSGSGDGFQDSAGSNLINIGHNGVIETQNTFSNYAIDITLGANDIFNQGSINGEVRIQGAGSNLFQNSGTIQNEAFAFTMYGIDNQIENTGSILGGNLGTTCAINLKGNSLVGNNFLSNSGTIAGVSGIQDDGVSGSITTISNDGNILGTKASGIFELTAASLDITNSGKISGETGIAFKGATDNDILSNSGSVFGHTTGVSDTGAASLNISNSVSGTISGGVGIDHSTGGGISIITNAGTIGATAGFAVLLSNSSGADIHNSGTISSSSGLVFSGGISSTATFGTTIYNSGTLSGVNGILLHGTVGDTVVNSGTISGSLWAFQENGSGTASLTNSGHIMGNVLFSIGTSTYDGTLGTVSGYVEAGSGVNTLLGGAGVETFDLSNGGTDTADAGAGNDLFKAGANLANSTIDGGTGNDTVELFGTYSNFTFNADTMVNVETLRVADGFLYKLKTDDATVAAGQKLFVNASALTGANTLTFDGSAETDGKFVVTGGAGNDSITASVGNDIINGGSGNDTLTSGAGIDIVGGNNGNDTFVFAANFTAADKVDGGIGTDKITLAGDYSGANALVLGATTMVNVETLSLGAGHNYAITTVNANVATGALLSVNGSALGAANTLTFNGAAETDGNFSITGGAGGDTITAGRGTDTVKAGGGNDTISFVASTFTAADKVDGGAGADTLNLSGDYTAAHALTLGATTMVGVETLKLGTAHSYSITTDNATVASGATLTVDASALDAAHVLIFNGGAETDGHFKITGGLGRDTLTGGSLSDTFIYTAAAQSSGTHYDTINLLDFGSDKLDVTGSITAIDATVNHSVSSASFNTDISAAASASHLLAGTAMMVSATAGSLNGHNFLVIDQNGVAGYQAGADLVIDMHLSTGTLSASDFI